MVKWFVVPLVSSPVKWSLQLCSLSAPSPLPMVLSMPFWAQEMVRQLAAEADAVFPALQALPLAHSAALFSHLDAAGVSYVGPASEMHKITAHKLRANQRISELGFPTMPMMALQLSDIESDATFEEWKELFVAWLEENGVDADIDKIFVKPAAGSGGLGVRFARGAGEAATAAYAILAEVLHRAAIIAVYHPYFNVDTHWAQLCVMQNHP